ncbi:MAG: conjugal transfer protein TraF [Deltaproteobacteria bacterium]|nr:conjugal transfer protein TraF [Deltaproteobacteria bacterium]
MEKHSLDGAMSLFVTLAIIVVFAFGSILYNRTYKKETSFAEMLQPVIPPPLYEKFTNDQLMKMHPDQIQYLVTLYLKKAVQSPSHENIKDYQSLQRIESLKAKAFGDAVRLESGGK